MDVAVPHRVAGAPSAADVAQAKRHFEQHGRLAAVWIAVVDREVIPDRASADRRRGEAGGVPGCGVVALHVDLDQHLVIAVRELRRQEELDRAARLSGQSRHGHRVELRHDGERVRGVLARVGVVWTSGSREVATRRVERGQAHPPHLGRHASLVFEGLRVSSASIGRSQVPSFVAVEPARASGRVERISVGGRIRERQAEVFVRGGVGAGLRRVSLRRAILEDHALKGLCPLGVRAAVSPDRQGALASAIGPVEPAVHLEGAGAIADPSQGNRFGETQSAHERPVGALDPNGDLSARGRGERHLHDAILCDRSRRLERDAEQDPQRDA